MSLRVPACPETRRALRETARALREGGITAARLLSWLAGEQLAADSLADRLKALEDRVNALETGHRSA
ncbi:hypothetical protein [Azospirillum sp. TSO22-1]|uniref:hypothetical protein n=1 Tax=Azospirillum sp. TSO22-1 TaxID=716789 RepID=UPI000D620839|nr:hypothetical protein [Azospirillum sp. TSO22-1]PWC56142.1 hypothetical protein TSO221_02565 [Azospirillum sp. TSO22-1]